MHIDDNKQATGRIMTMFGRSRQGELTCTNVVGGQADCAGAGDGKVVSRPGMLAAGKTLALASALLAAASVGAFAQEDPPAPAANRVWGGCTLSATTVDSLLTNELGAEFGSQAAVSFVVIYTLRENNGQRLTDTTDTGPVICTNQHAGINGAVEGITAQEADGDPLSEDSDIPGDTHDPVTEPVAWSSNLNILDTEQMFSLRYEIIDTGGVEKRVCHTVDANTDCFRIFR